MLKSIKVRDYMTTHQVTFHADTDLYAAIDLLLEHRLSAAPVVDEQGDLIGLLTEIDCLRGILSGAYYEESGGTVSACMTTRVETVAAELSVIEVAERLLQGGHHHLPVVADGRLLGQISCQDVLRAVKQFAQHESGQQTEG